MSCIVNKSASADRIWQVILESTETLRAAATGRYGSRFDISDLQDCFLALYQTSEPEFSVDDTIGKMLFAYKKGSASEWGRLRSWTKLNPIHSAVAAIGLFEEFNHLARNKGDDDAIKSLKGGHGSSGTVFKGAKKSVEAADEIHESLVAGGGSGKGGPENTSMLDLESEISVRLALAASLGTRRGLLKLIDTFGRLVLKFDEKDGGRSKGMEETDDVTVGRDLQNVLPSEFAQEDDLFDAAFLDYKLNQYEVVESKGEGLGPIIAMIDKSGSMNAPLYTNLSEDEESVSRDDFAVALSLVLMKIAKDQGRDLHLISFSGSVVGELSAIRGRFSADEIARFIRARTSGGTDFKPPIVSGLRKLDSDPGADLVMLTDGQCMSSYDEKWGGLVRSKIEEHGAKLIGLNVGKSGRTMKGVCHKLIENIEVEEKSEEALNAVFEQVSDRRKHFLENDWS